MLKEKSKSVQIVSDVFDRLEESEKNVIVVEHLKTLSKWDLKRVLCEVLGVESYMDDAGLSAEFCKIVNER